MQPYSNHSWIAFLLPQGKNLFQTNWPKISYVFICFHGLIPQWPAKIPHWVPVSAPFVPVHRFVAWPPKWALWNAKVWTLWCKLRSFSQLSSVHWITLSSLAWHWGPLWVWSECRHWLSNYYGMFGIKDGSSHDLISQKEMFGAPDPKRKL